MRKPDGSPRSAVEIFAFYQQQSAGQARNIIAPDADQALAPDPERDDAEAFDAVIDRTELGFANLHQRLLTLPEAPTSRVPLADQYAPFEFAAINQAENPKRNMATLRYWSKRGGPNSIEMTNRKFFYDRLDGDGGTALLAFDPPSRRVQVPKAFDPGSDFFLMALYHEIHHVLQDNMLRMQFASHYTDLTRLDTVVIDFEYTAYAHMFEQMDRLVEGRLRRITAGSYPSEQELHELNTTLAVPEVLRGEVKKLFFLAGCYFDPTTPNSRLFPQHFCACIDRTFQGKRLLRLQA